MMSIAVFVFCYLLFAAFPRQRSLVACLGGLLLVLGGALTWHQALVEKVNWNVIALFFGMLILAELFLQSRMPAVMAEALVDRAGTVRRAMMLVCALSGGLSMFVENVAVVLLVAPVAMSLCEKLKISPVRLLVCITVSANLQGTATLIGDPPSMILAGYGKMNFNDFFVYHGHPGIFFAVQVGALASLAVVYFLLRGFHDRVRILAVEKIQSWVPTVILVALLLGLSFSSSLDPEFKWLAGAMAMLAAGIGLWWYRRCSRWGSVRALIRTLDWDTTFFLIGVFVIVGAVSQSGGLDRLAGWICGRFGSSVGQAFLALLVLSVLVSAFVDNVPYLLAMIPVAQKVADTLHTPAPLLLFGLLVGSCMGGNITPIGASANVVTLGLLKKRGHLVSFREFLSVGLPFTLASVAAAGLFIWWIWKP